MLAHPALDLVVEKLGRGVDVELARRIARQRDRRFDLARPEGKEALDRLTAFLSELKP